MINKALYSSAKDDWETPDSLYDELNKEFKFDLDVAASDTNHKCWRYFTKDNSAFNIKWSGRVWCNPPYGREIIKWVEACNNYKGLSVMLIPARTDTLYFHKYIYHNPRCEIRFIKGRLKFSGSKNAAPFPSMIVIFKEVNYDK